MTNREKFLEVFGTTEIHQIASNEWMAKEYEEAEKEHQLKVFISQPMRGLTIEEVKLIRNVAIKEIMDNIIGRRIDPDQINVFFFDNIQEDLDPETTTSLDYLANDVKMLGEADLVYFTCGWEKSRGCNIEYQICKDWDIPMKFE